MGATVNLASKYHDSLGKVFSHGSFLKGNTNEELQFTGVKTITVVTDVDVQENDYTRGGTGRYGKVEELGDTIQEFTMTQDKSFTFSIDKGNAADQMNLKKAGERAKDQYNRVSAPNADKYAFAKYVKYAGKTAGLSAKPTKDTIVEAIDDADEYFNEKLVPASERILYITPEMYKLVRQSGRVTEIESVAKESLTRGMLPAEIAGFRIVKVPASFFPAGVYFLCTYKRSVLYPWKLEDFKYHSDPPGISGDLVEERHYFDAFVMGNMCDGVYAGVLSSAKQATPGATCATPGTSTLTITSTGASSIYYTLDGSDPRYSKTTAPYTAAIATTGYKAGDRIVVKAVAYNDSGFTSDVLETVFTVAGE